MPMVKVMPLIFYPLQSQTGQEMTPYLLMTKELQMIVLTQSERRAGAKAIRICTAL